jgi:hypothetical protein
MFIVRIGWVFLAMVFIPGCSDNGQTGSDARPKVKVFGEWDGTPFKIRRLIKRFEARRELAATQPRAGGIAAIEYIVSISPNEKEFEMYFGGRPAEVGRPHFSYVIYASGASLRRAEAAVVVEIVEPVDRSQKGAVKHSVLWWSGDDWVDFPLPDDAGLVGSGKDVR